MSTVNQRAGANQEFYSTLDFWHQYHVGEVFNKKRRGEGERGRRKRGKEEKGKRRKGERKRKEKGEN